MSQKKKKSSSPSPHPAGTQTWQGAGMPLGGLGTGCVDLCPDGLFREWNIMNNRPWGNGPKYQAPVDTAYFGCVADGQAAMLCAPPGGWDEELQDPYVLPYMNYPRITAEDRWPIARLKYRWSTDLPVQITLDAFSPFIPHDIDNSALPGILFEFQVRNVSGKTCRFSLFQVQKNLTDYTGKKRTASKFENGCVTLSREGKFSGKNEEGTMAFGVSGLKSTEVSYCLNARTIRDLWEPLREHGKLENTDFGGQFINLGNEGAIFNTDPALGASRSAVAATIRLAPGETRLLRFQLTWHFPFMKELPYQYNPQCTVHTIGHWYQRQFPDATAVWKYLAEHGNDLRKRTFAFRRQLEATSLPVWLRQAITAQLTTMLKSSWFDKKGRFAIWEGLGFCGLQTTDVSLYGSFAVLDFFPELEFSELLLTARSTKERGDTTHSMPGNFHGHNWNNMNRIDLMPDFVLMACRDILVTGDASFSRKIWPYVRDTLDFLGDRLDKEGVLYHKGRDQTYDQFPIFGTGAMTGFLQANAYQLAAAAARQLGEEDDARRWEAKSREITDILEKRLWNGRCYSLSNDVPNHRRSDGVMASQLDGEWFSLQAGQPGVLSPARRLQALQTILQCNIAKEGYLRNCTWANPEEAVHIGRHTADQANWPWTGVEYAVAAHLALNDMVPQALQVAGNVFDRYERTGMRFCHIECGPHYHRAMSIWALHQALCGCRYAAATKTLTFRLDRYSKIFLLLPGIRGTAEWKNERLQLKLQEGRDRIRHVHFTAPDGREHDVPLKKQI